MTTHLDGRANPGDGAEAGRPDTGAVADPSSTIDEPEPGSPWTEAGPSWAEAGPSWAEGTAATDPDGWDEPPAAPHRSPMPTQGALSRLGDVLVSPFGRRRRETMVLLSLVVLALLVWVAVTELLVAPGASQSILS